MFLTSGRKRLKNTAVPILKGPINLSENVGSSCLPGPSSDGNSCNAEGGSSNYDVVSENPEIQDTSHHTSDSDLMVVASSCKETSFSDVYVEENNEFATVSASVNQTKAKKRVRRLCSVEGCVSNNVSHSMFRFPPVMKLVNEEYIVDDNEIKSWMVFCDNRELLSKDIRKLHQTDFVCSDHFPDNMFATCERKRLKNTAVPILKGPINLLENVGLSCLPGLSSDGNSCNAEGGSSNYDLVAENPKIQDTSHHISDCATMVVGSSCKETRLSDVYVEENNEFVAVSASVNQTKAKKRVRRLCSVEGCVSNNVSHSMFRFPPVMKLVNEEYIVDDNEIKR
ncbi:hypothetical protein KUF71_017134 [Frankliniella fusca]|uniref:THAP-type domain-containing protein n=1 Tax=Frankliniella fusca TaxID=407009 RepID=A0AAE1LRD5_9NEOP|nr:hypothetical protein KUF71_017134 [Frankliniella fusca]